MTSTSWICRFVNKRRACLWIEPLSQDPSCPGGTQTGRRSASGLSGVPGRVELLCLANRTKVAIASMSAPAVCAAVTTATGAAFVHGILAQMFTPPPPPDFCHLMCVHIENPLFSELRIPYCVRAGETATFQLRYPPEKSRFQTGFTLAPRPSPFASNRPTSLTSPPARRVHPTPSEPEQDAGRRTSPVCHFPYDPPSPSMTERSTPVHTLPCA